MTDTVPSPARTAPTPAEIEAAARILMRAWAPGMLLPGDHPKTDDPVAEDYDPSDHCGCAGETDDGEPLGCNCGPGCTCDECSYFAFAMYKRCWVKGCGKTPAFRVVRYAMVEQYVQEPTVRGAVCPHADGERHYCTPNTVYISAGLRLQTFGGSPACSLAHAVQLRDAQQPDSHAQYYIESWTYTPHDSELPAPLPQMREHTRSARDRTSYAIKAYAASHDPGYWLTSARQSLALAAWHARRPIERPGDEDGWDDEVSSPEPTEPPEPDSDDT